MARPASPKLQYENFKGSFSHKEALDVKALLPPRSYKHFSGVKISSFVLSVPLTARILRQFSLSSPTLPASGRLKIRLRDFSLFSLCWPALSSRPSRLDRDLYEKMRKDAGATWASAPFRAPLVRARQRASTGCPSTPSLERW